MCVTLKQKTVCARDPTMETAVDSDIYCETNLH